MLRVGRVFERGCVSVFRAFGSGPVPPNSKYIKPKPGAGQKEGLEEKSKKLMESISKLKEQSDKRAEAAEEQMAQMVETKFNTKDVSNDTDEGFQIFYGADRSDLYRSQHIYGAVQTGPISAEKFEILVC